jgi:hypothetical protein
MNFVKKLTEIESSSSGVYGVINLPEEVSTYKNYVKGKKIEELIKLKKV